nr:hypothetical protein [Janthinobacterium sp. Marseille]
MNATKKQIEDLAKLLVQEKGRHGLIQSTAPTTRPVSVDDKRKLDQRFQVPDRKKNFATSI